MKRNEDLSPATSLKNVFHLANNDDNKSELQNNADTVEDMEIEYSSVSQPSSPIGLSAPLAPPQAQASQSSQQKSAETFEDMEVEYSS